MEPKLQEQRNSKTKQSKINDNTKCLDYWCENKPSKHKAELKIIDIDGDKIEIINKAKSELCLESYEYLQEGIIKPCDDDHCPFYIDTKGPRYCPNCAGDPENRMLIG